MLSPTSTIADASRSAGVRAVEESTGTALIQCDAFNAGVAMTAEQRPAYAQAVRAHYKGKKIERKSEEYGEKISKL